MFLRVVFWVLEMMSRGLETGWFVGTLIVSSLALKGLALSSRCRVDLHPIFTQQLFIVNLFVWNIFPDLSPVCLLTAGLER
jgi:hypothetical protein